MLISSSVRLGVRSLCVGQHKQCLRMAHTSTSTDIVIVGGGVVGLAMLAGLVSNRSLPAMKVALIDTMNLSNFASWKTNKERSTRPATPQHDGIQWENRVISMNMDNLAWMQHRTRMRNVERMCVWDGLSDAAAEFGPGPPPSGALSAMVEISNAQQALYRLIKQHQSDPSCRVKVEILDQTHVKAIHAPSQDAWPEVKLASEHGDRCLKTRLLVGADGNNSPVRTFAGIESYGWPYDRKGLVATLRTGLSDFTTEPLVDSSAWQRFLPSGTLAFLPLSSTTGTIVWALPPQFADALSTLHRADAGNHDPSAFLATFINGGFRLPWSVLEEFLHRAQELAKHSSPDTGALQSSIQDALMLQEEHLGPKAPSAHLGTVPVAGDAVDVRSVASFPLQLKHAGCYLGSTLNRNLNRTFPMPSTVIAGAMTALGLTPGGAGRGQGQGRTVLVGDAAHTTHPLSGQGLNLGIQDVRALNEAIHSAIMQGMDIGTDAALRPYEAARYLPNQAMLSVTDHLHWLFATTPASPHAPATGITGHAREAALKGLVWARSMGLDVVNELGPLKQFFLQGAGSKTKSSF